MARDDILNADGQLQLMQGSEEDRNCKEKERMKLRTRSSSGSKPGSDEQIHSGHFMVSDPHRGKKKDRVGFDFVSANKQPSTSYSFGGNKQCPTKEIDSSFTKLFECMSLAYNGGTIVSPKWKWFRGLKLSTRDKIRLNNAIWREWHMQFRIGLPPVICQFGSPLAETNHNVPEAVILEGKYWKRTPSTVVHEYNKWRIFMMQQKKLASSGKTHTELTHTDLMKQMQRDVINEEPMVFEDSFFADFHDTLFSSLNPPFAFPNPKEIAHMNNSDMIQPGLIQLQPTLESSLDDFMDTLEPFQVDLSRSLSQSSTSTGSPSPFVFTGCGTSHQQTHGTLIQPPRLETQLLQVPMNSLETHQPPMQSLQTNQGLNTATDFMNSQLLSNSSLDQPSNTSLFDNVQVNDLTQFQGPYPVQITEALCNTSKYEFTESLVEQFRQEEAQLDQLAKRQTENAVQNVTQLLTQQQNVGLLNPIAEQQITLSGQQTIQNVHPSGTFVSVTQPMFTAPQENVQNHQGTILTNSAVQILQQAANQASQAAEQKHVITQFLKAPILQPQQAAQTVQFTQPTASIMLPTVSTHQVLVPMSVSQPTRRNDVFAVPKSKPPARRIAPAPPPPTTSSVNKVSTTALLSHLLNKDKKSANFAIAQQPPSGIGNTATAVLVPTSILKTEFSTNPPCVISNTCTTPTIFTISSSSMVTSAAAATTLTPTNSPVSASTMSPLAVIADSSEAYNRDDDDKDFKKISTHISAEQKRRFNIKSGFDMLHSLIPSINQNPSSKISKASMLQKGVEYTKKLQQERAQCEKEIALLRQEVAVLNISINETQAQLPASGVPVTRQRFDQMQSMFDDYVRERTKHNWKFWIFSIIIRPLFESFNTVVSTTSTDELFRTVLSWLDQHCSLLALRPTVLSSLTLLSRTTSILSNPEQMPQQAAKAVNNE